MSPLHEDHSGSPIPASSSSESGSGATSPSDAFAAAMQLNMDLIDVNNDLPPPNILDISFTWSGKTYTAAIPDSDLVLDLKALIQSLTNVPPQRQKIILKKGKLPSDDARISEFKLIPGKPFTVIGTPEGEELKAPPQPTSDADNDFDLDFSSLPAAVAQLRTDARNIRKIKEALDKLEVNVLSPFRPGKRLLVLDIDYTILDTKPLTTGSLPPIECARPGLHEFLEAVYPYYDICIWSQTSWIWLETKLVELGMIGGMYTYQISFVLDKNCMFTVYSQRDGKPWSHSVKALPIIWTRFPQFNAGNTIHIDDLSRNFALNVPCGLKIKAFRNAHTAEAKADRELLYLCKYLTHIATLPDFSGLDHREWKKALQRLAPPQ